MKVLLLGGAGYIGSMLSEYLHERGDEVVIFDNLLYEQKPWSFTPLENVVDRSEAAFKPSRFIHGDIRNEEELAPAIKAADAVVNLAALSNDPASDLDPGLAMHINYRANKSIARLCRRLGKRIVYASSCSVYGFSDVDIFDETSALGPVTLYARTKMLSEQLYLDANIDAVLLRFATVYGCTPRPRFDLVVNTMIGTSYFDKQIIVNGGIQWRPLVHVKDAAHAIYLAVHAAPPKFKIFNVGSNEQNYRIAELAQNIGRAVPDATVIHNVKSIDQRSYRVDFSRIADTLKFQARYSIRDAIAEFYQAFRKKKILSMDEDVYYRVKYLKKYSILSKLPINSHVSE